MKRRLHSSWFLTWISAGILGGTALAAVAPHAHFYSGEWLVIAVALVSVIIIKPLRIFVVLAIASGLLIGLWRGAQTRAGLQAYQPYYGQTVTLEGKISQDSTYGPRGEQRLRLMNVKINQNHLPGTVWVSTGSLANLKRGDHVTLDGHLSEGFGTIAASLHRAELVRAERPYPGDVARRVRDWFAAGVRRGIPEPEASLGVGYLVGQRSSLPETLDEQLRAVGLTHIVVASGYNLTILVRFARRLFARVSKYLAALSAGSMIGGFMLVTGFSPSMSRAGLVAGLSLAAWYYGRVIHPVVLLLFAAAVTALINPGYIWADIGWYLSFISFAGVIILAPLLNHYFWGQSNRPGFARQILIDTFSAQLLTLPLIIYVFGQYSGYALLANLLVLPVVPIIMFLTFLGGLAGVLLPAASTAAGLPANLLLSYSTGVVGWVSNLPGARSEAAIGAPAMLAAYVFLVLFIIVLRRHTRHDFRHTSLVE
jgi:competence protein ComEC